MEILKIDATESTPYIYCDAESGRIEFKGRSIPENATNFYSPVNQWIDKYCTDTQSEVELQFYLDYINSISQKIFLDIFQKFAESKQAGKDVRVVWMYEIDDEEMEEEGKIFASKVDLEFELIVMRD